MVIGIISNALMLSFEIWLESHPEILAENCPMMIISSPSMLGDRFGHYFVFFNRSFHFKCPLFSLLLMLEDRFGHFFVFFNQCCHFKSPLFPYFWCWKAGLDKSELGLLNERSWGTIHAAWIYICLNICLIFFYPRCLNVRIHYTWEQDASDGSDLDDYKDDSAWT